MSTKMGNPGQSTGKADREPSSPRQVIGRFIQSQSSATDNGQAAPLTTPGSTQPRHNLPAVAVFCSEPPDSFLGGHVTQIVKTLAQRGNQVHLFCRFPFDLRLQGLTVHNVGNCEEGDLVDQAQEFARRASNAFMQVLPSGTPAVIGYEWGTASVLSLLRGLRNQPAVLSLHSLEQQRSDLTSPISQRISELEREGLQAASLILHYDDATAAAARQMVPACADRLVHARTLFNPADFEGVTDPGAIKALYQVGPIDPLLLFIGDLDERYGPDLLLRAMPALLRHHKQARLVIVGDGHLYWPLRVYSRYLLLEYAVRQVGDVRGKALHELIQAADVMVVPSRQSTPWWPIQAAWAARRPVVATHEAAPELTEHEKDAILIYPSENSVVWGVERVLYDEELRQNIGLAGRRKVEERFGWNEQAEQLEDLLAATLAR